MKNVTISMDDDLVEAVRAEAEKAGKSMSRYIVDVLARLDRTAPPKQTDSERVERLAALERVFAGPKWNIMMDGRMPTADERNER